MEALAAWALLLLKRSLFWQQVREGVREATLEGKALKTPEGTKVRCLPHGHPCFHAEGCCMLCRGPKRAAGTLRMLSALGVPKQAQAMREEAERLFAEHRARGGFAAARDKGTPPEEREALWGLKKQGDLLWEQAGELVKAASDSVLNSSQVFGLHHRPALHARHGCCLINREPHHKQGGN
jgi:hypothetical protein